MEVTLREGATIAGLILGLEPDELSRVEVEATLGHGNSRRAEIEAEGRYRLVSLEPGAWTIRASLRSATRCGRRGRGSRALQEACIALAAEMI